ncbi:MAG: helical backbone metal receptor [Dermatophilaceae bacterium]
MTTFRDGTGAAVPLPAPPRRVVSLVPSLTEALAASLPMSALVGATDWCTHPAGLTVPRFGGTKNPDVARIVEATPDLVVANEEENKPEHVAALRAAGVPVWVTDIRTVAGALTEIGALLDALAAPERGWLAEAERYWAAAGPVVSGRTVDAVIPIWRRPWMFVGPDTYAGDVLARLGVRNVLGSSPDAGEGGLRVGDLDATERYPRRELTGLPPYDLVVLPDEPYRFTAHDGPEAFAPTPCALVDGRSLTWYGPAMIDAPRVVAGALHGALAQ